MDLLRHEELFRVFQNEFHAFVRASLCVPYSYHSLTLSHNLAADLKRGFSLDCSLAGSSVLSRSCQLKLILVCGYRSNSSGYSICIYSHLLYWLVI